MLTGLLLLLAAAGSRVASFPVANNGTTGRKVVCYYNQDQTPVLHRLDPTLCTHIIVGFMTLENGSYTPTDPTGLSQAKELRTRNPALKILVSVGTSLASYILTPLDQRQLAQTTILYVRGLEADGVDYDWEFPRWSTKNPSEKTNFADYLLILREAIEEEARSTDKEPLLISVAVAAPRTIISVAYDIPKMAEAVDFINLMTYDFYFFRWYFPFTAPNAPLFPRPIEKGIFRTMNTAWAAQHWNQSGMPKEKIMVGIPFYGRTWRLVNAHVHGLNSLSTSQGFGGGFASYPSVCEILENGGTRKYNEASKTPYVYRGRDWISYDDEISVAAKAEWINEQDYGGAMIYNLNCDDWNVTCSNTTAPFPLLTVVANTLL